ncbi:peptidoglycan-binding protein [Kitasatospora sp. NPDC052896]|uniref:peptidoglycan-binding protein n=1 Tax=Kitasatospora sp. NPDC052896 TaxID=3364061 RepID=UPI0037C559AC
MSTWTSLEPASTTVEAGTTATVSLRLRNTGDVVEEYRFVPVGEPAPWARVEPASVKLYPGTGTTVQLHFDVPRSSDAAAGPHPFALQVLPSEQPEAVVVVEGVLSVLPFGELRAELVPPVSKGRLRARPQLAVDNLGNTPVTVSLAGKDAGNQLDFEFQPSSLRIQAGRAAFVRVSARTQRIRWFGVKQVLPFSVNVLRSGLAPLPVEGTYAHSAVLPRWFPRLFAVLGAIVAACVALWMLAKPSVTSAATALRTQTATLQPVDAGSPLPPQPTTGGGGQPAPGNAAPPQPGGPVAPDAGNPAAPQAAGPTPLAPGPGANPVPAAPGGGGGGGGGAPGGGGGAPGGGGGGGSTPEAMTLLQFPITSVNATPTSPNLFVQFAQDRLVSLSSGNRCKLARGSFRTGVMDQNTVNALACFQRDTDTHGTRPGNIARSDQSGTLGRATMAALEAFPVIRDIHSINSNAQPDYQISCATAALMWADQTSLTATQLQQQIGFTQQLIKVLTSGSAEPISPYNEDFANAVRKYQADMAPQKPLNDSDDVANALIGGWVVQPTTQGTIQEPPSSGTGWPGVYQG